VYVLSDLRYAIRFLSRAPAFTVPAIVSLALGIAVNTTMFSVVNAVLLKPIAAPDNRKLVQIGRSRGGDGSFRSASYDEFRYVRDHAGSFTEVLGTQMESVAMDGPSGSQMLTVELVAGSYFPMLGVLMVLGRGFTAGEHSGNAGSAVAVISDRLWRRRFGADPAAIGSSLRLNNVPFTVVGVASAGFAGVSFPGVIIEAWLPMAMTHTVMHRTDGFPPSMGMLGRLKDGTSISAARAELRVLARRMSDENPARDRDRGLEVARAQGVHPGIASALRVVLALLMGVVALVLLIACANVAGALLARASARQRELAVRLALGASRGRVVAQLLTESFLLASLGGGAGLLLAIWPVRLLNTVFATVGPPGMETFLGFQVDHRVLLFTATVATLTTFVFGLLPALHATRVDVMPALKDARALIGGPRTRLRGALMIVQVAVSFVLLVAAGLLFRSLHNAVTIDVGFNPDGLVVASFSDLRSFGFDGPRGDRFHREWLTQVRTLPGVEQAAAAEFIPLGSGGHPDPLRIEGAPPSTGRDELTVAVGRVSEEYFATMGCRSCAAVISRHRTGREGRRSRS